MLPQPHGPPDVGKSALSAAKAAGIKSTSLYIKSSIILGAKRHCWNGFRTLPKRTLLITVMIIMVIIITHIKF